MLFAICANLCIISGMKSRQTKAELREELAQQVQRYIDQGGEIHAVGMGESGLVDGKYDTRRFGFDSKPQQRTPVANLLSTIDSRKSKKRSSTVPKASKRLRKKVIYDDFGEPLRWVWVTE